MMGVRVVLLPELLKPDDLAGRAVAVFDVFRATTTMAAAILAGAEQIRLYGSVEDARAAAQGFRFPKLLVGERGCVPPAGFDLGNSPGDFLPERCAGRTIFMSTTNGTKAILAARKAAELFTGSIANARATANALQATGLPITLLCAGTNGEIAPEDTTGCGAVLAALGNYHAENNSVEVAEHHWRSAGNGGTNQSIGNSLVWTPGAQQIIKAGLSDDLKIACARDKFNVACRVRDILGELVVTRHEL